MVYQFFPRSHGITAEINKVVNCFESIKDKIDSTSNNLRSNEVLEILRPQLVNINFSVETGKKNDEKIPVPVLFGMDNTIDRQFFADAISDDGRIVIEVEAGQAVENNKYIKCIFQACLMFDVEYLVLAIRRIYRNRLNYDTVYSFLETLYISNRLKLPLKGILLIGY